MVAILHPAGQGTQILIDRAVVLIGRSPECDVVLDVSSKISRMHCALVQVDSDYFIRDLGSMNGVTVAGQRIEKDAKLSNGVEVLIGDVKFLFLENVMPAAKPARSLGIKGSPVFIDETVDVLEVDEVEVVEPAAQQHCAAKPSPVRPLQQHGVRKSQDAGNRSPRLPAVAVDDVVIIDDVEVIDAVEVVDVEVIEDVDVIDEEPRRSRPRSRLR